MIELIPCAFCHKEPSTDGTNESEYIKCCGFEVYKHTKWGSLTTFEDSDGVAGRWNLLQSLFRIAENELQETYTERLKNEANETE
jgi:hypothetical protein